MGFNQAQLSAGTDEIFGFNVDGVTSDGSGTSCEDVFADSVSSDGRTGIDNQLGGLVSSLGTEISIVNDLVRDSINDGGVLYIVEISNYTGLADTKLDLKLKRSRTVPLLGNDSKLLSGQTYRFDKDGPDSLMAEIYDVPVKNGVVSSQAFELKMPMNVLDLVETLRVSDARVEFTIDEQGNLKNGVVGGGLHVDTILEIAEKYAVGAEVRATINGVVPQLTDIDSDGDGECGQMSVALLFEAVQGFMVD